MTGPRRAAGDRGRDERGSVAVMTTFIAVVAVALAVMVTEAGVALTAATRADVAAAEGARAAAIGAGPAGSSGLAVAAAESYLVSAGYPDGAAAVVSPGVVSVTVTVTGRTPLLGITFSKTATHRADLLLGADQGGTP